MQGLLWSNIDAPINTNLYGSLLLCNLNRANYLRTFHRKPGKARLEIIRIFGSVEKTWSTKMSDSYEFKIQYVDDLDPFNVLASIKHVEPTVAKKFSVLKNVPLIDQLGSMKKSLRAPHKVSPVVSKWYGESRPNTPGG